MNKFKSKKGFTLAELLIVVAIIAVLVAIAVPLFVGGLNKAQDATFQANKRAVKSAAAVKILVANDGEKAVDLEKIFAKGNHVAAKATVTDKGDIENLEITYGTTEVTETEDYNAWIAAKRSITVEITLTDLESATITPGT